MGIKCTDYAKDLSLHSSFLRVPMTVIKCYDQKKLGEEMIYFRLKFLIPVFHQRKSGREVGVETGDWT